MTFIEKFDSIKKKFSKPDQSKLTEDFAVQINLTDTDCGGAFYIAYMNDIFAVEPYDYHDHTAMVTTDAKTFDGFLTKKKTIEDMTVDGNKNHVEMIAIAIEKKPAAKKRTVKKETVKKESEKPAVKKTSVKTAAAKTTAKNTVKAAAKKADEIKSEVKAEVKEVAKKAETAIKKAETAVKKAAEDAKKK